MLRVSVEVQDGEFNEKLSGFVEQLDDLKPAYHAIIGQFLEEQAKVFDSEGAFGGRSGWRQLSPEYEKWKKSAAGSGAKILHLTGGLVELLNPVSPNTGTRRTATGKTTRAKLKGSRLQQGRRTFAESLRASFTDRESAVIRVSKWGFFVGSGVTVGKWNLAELHQTGTNRMPSRPPIRITREQGLRWLAIIRRWLLRKST